MKFEVGAAFNWIFIIFVLNVYFQKCVEFRQLTNKNSLESYACSMFQIQLAVQCGKSTITILLLRMIVDVDCASECGF